LFFPCTSKRIQGFQISFYGRGLFSNYNPFDPYVGSYGLRRKVNATESNPQKKCADVLFCPDIPQAGQCSHSFMERHPCNARLRCQKQLVPVHTYEDDLCDKYLYAAHKKRSLSSPDKLLVRSRSASSKATRL